MTDFERAKAEMLDRLLDGYELAQPVPDELRPLAGLALELRRTLAPAAATASTRDRMLSRVVRRIRSQAPPAQSRPARQPRRIFILRPAYAIASLAMVLTLAFGTGAAYAAESTLPGDALYPVKLGLEEARLALSLTVAGDASLAASFADRRLAEIETLTARGRWVDAGRALGAYPTFVDELVRLEAQITDADKAARIEAQLARHLEVLERVRGQAPESAQPALLQAMERAGRGQLEVKTRHEKDRPEHVPPGQEKKGTDSPGNSGGQD
jgi:hypothetical protein